LILLRTNKNISNKKDQTSLKFTVKNEIYNGINKNCERKKERQVNQE